MSAPFRLKENQIVDMPEGRCRFLRRTGDILDFIHLADASPVYKTVPEFTQLIREGKVEPIGQHVLSRAQNDNAYVDEAVPPGISPQALLAARTRRFYASRFHEAPTHLGDVSLREFIDKHKPDAETEGLTWNLSEGTLCRAIKIGSPGERPLFMFLSRRGKHPKVKEKIGEKAAYSAAETFYWSARGWTYTDGHARYLAKFNEFYADVPKDEQPRKITLETFRKRIDRGANWERWAIKFSSAEANARYDGVGESITAERPLQKVIIDHTLVDAWVGYDDATATPLGRMWLTLAIDVRTRMILATVVTFEPPSLYSIMEAVIQICTPKDDWQALYPMVDFPYDGWGRPEEIIVDNEWAHVGGSFQDACKDAGIKVTWAPIKSPTYKAIGERIFLTFNTKIWHKLPGAVPYKPEAMSLLGLDPGKYKMLGREALLDHLHATLVNDYSRAVHDGIDAQPARMWEEEIKREGRPWVGLAGLRAALGAVDEATLSRAGIRFRNATFHDEVATTVLLETLSHLMPKRESRRGPMASATAKVKIKYSPVDFSQIHVWVPAGASRPGRYVALPNTMKRLSKGMTFRDWEQIRKYRKAENEAFCSEEEWMLARDERNRRIEEEFANLKGLARKRAARHLSRDDGLLRGDHVAELTAPASVNGMASPSDLEFGLGLETRTGQAMPAKGPKRGGARSRRPTAVVQEAREKTQEVADMLLGRQPAPAKPKPQPASDPPPRPPSSAILDDAEAASLMAQLRQKRKGKWV